MRALAPAAEALDARFGGDALRRAVADVLSRPLQGREELSKEYGAVVMGTRGADDIAALARRARERNQPDIELGLIFFLPPGRQDLDRYRAVAQRTQDPWFAALADEMAAWRELTGQPIRGLELLLPRHRACAGSDRVEERCLTIERAVLALYLELQQGAEARAAGVRALERSRRDGDFQTELWLLVLLGEVARIQSDLDLAHGYLEEAALRAPQDCGLVQRAHTNLALAHHRVLDFAGARREVEKAVRCDRAPSTQLLAELADLERVDPRPDDAALFERGMAAARQAGQWSESLLLHYEGRFALARDPEDGERLLRRSIQEAERAPAGDPWASRARAYSYTSLILEAGRRGDFTSAMALFAEERRQSPPLRCALALAADDDRFVAVAAGPDGQPKGRAEGAPASPSQRRPFATPDFQEVLRGCPEVQVLSRPPLEGRVKGVPPEIAWSERLGTRSEAEPPAPGGRPWSGLRPGGWGSARDAVPRAPPADLRRAPARGAAAAPAPRRGAGRRRPGGAAHRRRGDPRPGAQGDGGRLGDRGPRARHRRRGGGGRGLPGALARRRGALRAHRRRGEVHPAQGAPAGAAGGLPLRGDGAVRARGPGPAGRLHPGRGARRPRRHRTHPRHRERGLLPPADGEDPRGRLAGHRAARRPRRLAGGPRPRLGGLGVAVRVSRPD